MARFTLDRKAVNKALLARNSSVFELAKETGIPYGKLRSFMSRPQDKTMDALDIYFTVCEWLGVSLYHFVKDSQSDKVIGDLARFKKIMEG